LRLGVLVGPAALIRQARRIRRLETSQPPLSLQRVAAHLLSLGHYDAIMLRIGQAFQRRMIALRDALNHYLPRSITIGRIRGGTAYWVRGPEGLDARDLARAAEARGVLVEPAAHYYAGTDAQQNEFRVAVASIPEERIRSGVAALAEAIRSATAAAAPSGVVKTKDYLSGPELRRAMSGATLLCKTVYGDPCTIELATNGRMTGSAGFANEETDEGRWWIEDDVWCRQWRSWAYGEAARFRTRIDGDQIQWFNNEGRLIDAAVIVRPDNPRRRD
jgi:GntR family transcriptional regulator/MocR family aminotransferase